MEESNVLHCLLLNKYHAVVTFDSKKSEFRLLFVDGKNPLHRTPVVCYTRGLGGLLSSSTGPNLLNAVKVNRGMLVVFPAKRQR
jgi:hypothetical protein